MGARHAKRELHAAGGQLTTRRPSHRVQSATHKGPSTGAHPPTRPRHSFVTEVFLIQTQQYPNQFTVIVFI